MNYGWWMLNALNNKKGHKYMIDPLRKPLIYVGQLGDIYKTIYYHTLNRRENVPSKKKNK